MIDLTYICYLFFPPTTIQLSIYVRKNYFNFSFNYNSLFLIFIVFFFFKFPFVKFPSFLMQGLRYALLHTHVIPLLYIIMYDCMYLGGSSFYICETVMRSLPLVQNIRMYKGIWKSFNSYLIMVVSYVYNIVTQSLHAFMYPILILYT